MKRLGRYGIAFGPVLWFQTKTPMKVRHFWWFWLLIEAKPGDADEEQSLTGTGMQEGRKYRYWKAGEEEKRECRT